MSLFALQLSLPMFALALLTFVLLMLLAISRYSATKNRLVSLSFYKVYIGEGEPEKLRQLTRNYSNLLESPVLFYSAIVLTIVLKIESATLLYIAWAYVVLRYVHTLVHITYNSVRHRFVVFVLSVLILITYWVTLFVQVVEQIQA